jgi:hypothetical protein
MPATRNICGIPFEEGNEILAAGESIQKLRVKFSHLLVPAAAANVDGDHPYGKSSTQAIVERMIVRARGSDICFHTFRAM